MNHFLTFVAHLWLIFTIVKDCTWECHIRLITFHAIYCLILILQCNMHLLRLLLFGFIKATSTVVLLQLVSESFHD